MSSAYRTSETKKCDSCHLYIELNKYEEHANLHIKPKFLAPSPLENNVSKIKMSFAFEDTTDESDLALRSILPEELPQPEKERKEVKAPLVDEHINNNIIDLQSLPAQPDFNDLNSKIATISLGKEDIEMLNMEKKINLNPKATLIRRKEIHRYKNQQLSLRENKDYEKIEKKDKVTVSLLNGQLPSQPVYIIQEDETNKPRIGFLSPSNKQKIRLQYKKIIQPPQPYAQIDTRANKDISKPYRQIVETQSNKDQKVKISNPHREMGHNHQLECEECHGFYCRTCKSTIPSKYRPIYDQIPQEQDEEIKNYYKRLAQITKMRENCTACQKWNKKQE